MTEFEIVDMFADRGCAGSGLAVLPEAGELQDAQMKLLARELGQPETAFVLPGTDEADYRVRVFTPAGETAFGGHSSLGTAATLVRLGRLAEGPVVQQCGTRRTRLEVTAGGGRIVAHDPLPSTDAPVRTLLSMAGLPRSAHSGAPVRACGFGPLFHFLPVCPEAVARARLVPAEGQPDVIVFAWDPAAGTAHCRVFAPGYDMPEDPACASAALGMAVWLAETGAITGVGTHEFRVRQGAELDRPSTVECTVTLRAGAVVAASAGGRVVPVAAGRLVPP